MNKYYNSSSDRPYLRSDHSSRTVAWSIVSVNFDSCYMPALVNLSQSEFNLVKAHQQKI